MTAWRHVRATMDALLVVAGLLALIALVRGGRAYGLMVASAGVSVWLASVIFDQLQVRAGSARLFNAHGQALEVDGSPEGARVAHWPGAPVGVRGRRDPVLNFSRAIGPVPSGESSHLTGVGAGPRQPDLSGGITPASTGAACAGETPAPPNTRDDFAQVAGSWRAR